MREVQFWSWKLAILPPKDQLTIQLRDRWQTGRLTDRHTDGTNFLPSTADAGWKYWWGEGDTKTVNCYQTYYIHASWSIIIPMLYMVLTSLRCRLYIILAARMNLAKSLNDLSAAIFLWHMKIFLLLWFTICIHWLRSAPTTICGYLNKKIMFYCLRFQAGVFLELGFFAKLY